MLDTRAEINYTHEEDSVSSEQSAQIHKAIAENLDTAVSSMLPSLSGLRLCALDVERQTSRHVYVAGLRRFETTLNVELKT